MIPKEHEFELRYHIALARLGVAEELRWVIAALAGILGQLYWHTWPASLGIAIFAFFAVTYPFSKEYDRALDAYERAAGIGKYWQPGESIQTLVPTHQGGENQKGLASGESADGDIPAKSQGLR